MGTEQANNLTPAIRNAILLPPNKDVCDGVCYKRRISTQIISLVSGVVILPLKFPCDLLDGFSRALCHTFCWS